MYFIPSLTFFVFLPLLYLFFSSLILTSLPLLSRCAVSNLDEIPLSHLDVSHNALTSTTSEGEESLMTSLLSLHRLQRLQLFNNGLGDGGTWIDLLFSLLYPSNKKKTGAKELASFISKVEGETAVALRSLEYLNLGANVITDAGAVALAQALETAALKSLKSGPAPLALKTLEIYGNPFAAPEEEGEGEGEEKKEEVGEGSDPARELTEGEKALQSLLDAGIPIDIAWQSRVVGGM